MQKHDSPFFFEVWRCPHSFFEKRGRSSDTFGDRKPRGWYRSIGRSIGFSADGRQGRGNSSGGVPRPNPSPAPGALRCIAFTGDRRGRADSHPTNCRRSVPLEGSSVGGVLCVSVCNCRGGPRLLTLPALNAGRAYRRGDQICLFVSVYRSVVDCLPGLGPPSADPKPGPPLFGFGGFRKPRN